MASLGLCQAELTGALPVLQHGRISPVQIELPAGQRLKLRLRNMGPGPIEFENLDLRIEKVLAERSESFVVLAGWAVVPGVPAAGRRPRVAPLSARLTRRTGAWARVSERS